jgi:hypothetical protein
MDKEQLIQGVTAHLTELGCDQITHNEGDQGKTVAFLFHAQTQIVFTLATPGWFRAEVQLNESPLGLWGNVKFTQ